MSEAKCETVGGMSPLRLMLAPLAFGTSPAGGGG